MFYGFAERLTAELRKMFPFAIKQSIEVIAQPNRQHLAWVGAAMKAAEMDDSMWISRAEFAEDGPQIVHRKCW